MAFLVTASDVSFALVEGRAVFLDARRDRYATLPPDLTNALAGALARDGAVAPDDPMVVRLLATELFELSSEPGVVAQTVHCPPASGIADAARGPFHPTDLVEVWALLALVARGLRKAPFRTTLAPPRIATAAPGRHRKAQLESLACRFLRARTFVPIAPACLADSLALRAWLARRGFGCGLTLAVRLEPFEAHCWIEVGGVVLNDAPARIATFVPVSRFA